MPENIVLGKSEGKLVAEHRDVGVNGPYSFRYYLTPCCLADATGVSWGSGIACRACYGELAESFGALPGALSEVFGDGVPLAEYREKVRP